MGIPLGDMAPSTVDTVAPPGIDEPMTAPMAKPEEESSGPAPISIPGLEFPPLRSGRTLSGGPPMPPRSGRTLPGGVKAAEPEPEATDGRGGPPSIASGLSMPLPGGSDKTEALTPEQAKQLAMLGKSASPPPSPVVKTNDWQGAGVERTMLAPPNASPNAAPSAPSPAPPSSPSPAAQPPRPAPPSPPTPPASAAPPSRPAPPAPSAPQPAAVDEGARTLAMPRYDRTMLAGPGGVPSGPMGWGDGDSQKPAGADPLIQTQKSATAGADPLLSTQKSPASPLMSTQRAPSAAFDAVNESAAEVRRPEMRSPSPRPAGTPRSLWITVMVLFVLAGLGVGLWLGLT